MERKILINVEHAFGREVFHMKFIGLQFEEKQLAYGLEIFMRCQLMTTKERANNLIAIFL